METQEQCWITLANAGELYDEGTLTVWTADEPGTPAYLASLVSAGMLAGRIADTGVEIQVTALEVIIERDLEAFIRQGDEEELAS